MYKRSVAILVSILISAVAGYSQKKSFKNEFGFQSDNDAYLALGQDRYYTNGLFITFRRATDQSKLNGKAIKKIWELEAGQKIYNPVTGRITNIDQVDRPFAGYLYAGGGINWLYRSENSLKTTLQAGVLGPSALGRETQELLHNAVGFYEIRGWEFQLNDEISFNGSAAYNHFIGRGKKENTDISATSYLNIGNTFSGAGIGLLLRAGTLNKFYHSVSNNSRIEHNPQEEHSGKNELFFYLKPQLNYVAYNASIQGGLFVKDKGPVTFDVKPLVFSQEAGVNYASDRWTVSYSIVFLTREIQSSAKAHQFGSVKIYYRFN